MLHEKLTPEIHELRFFAGIALKLSLGMPLVATADTAIHESLHALSALLVGGHIVEFVINPLGQSYTDFLILNSPLNKLIVASAPLLTLAPLEALIGFGGIIRAYEASKEHDFKKFTESVFLQTLPALAFAYSYPLLTLADTLLPQLMKEQEDIHLITDSLLALPQFPEIIKNFLETLPQNEQVAIVSLLCIGLITLLGAAPLITTTIARRNRNSK